MSTLVSDVVVPEVFVPYMIERTAELSAFFQSGIVAPVPELNMPDQGGSQVNMPFWQDLAGDDQVLDSGTDLTVGKIVAARDVAVLNARALVYGATDLAGALAGADPIQAVANLYASKWARQWQKTLINVLNGAMTPVTDNVFDISALVGAASNIDGASFVDALQRLGDAKDAVSAVAMHSATEARLAKNDLIQYLQDSEGSPRIPYFMGKRVIVDDGLPVDTDTYTTYIFGPGAIGYGEGAVKTPLEEQREGLKNGGETYLISRRHFVLHPRGIRWTGTPVGDTPTNAELANGANWTQAYESKNIRIVQFKHTLDAA